MVTPGIVASFGRSIIRGDRTFSSIREELKPAVRQWLIDHDREDLIDEIEESETETPVESIIEDGDTSW